MIIKSRRAKPLGDTELESQVSRPGVLCGDPGLRGKGSPACWEFFFLSSVS